MAYGIVLALIAVIVVVAVFMSQDDNDSGDIERELVMVDVPRSTAVYDGDDVIPKRIMQTYKGSKIPEGMSKAVQSHIDNNPTYEHVYMDNDACDAFMREHFKGDICDAYHCVRPGAYKCDIFRLAYLLIHGGWYIDISMVSLIPLDDMFYASSSNNPLVLVRDTPSGKYGVYQAFIGSRPGHPWIRAALNGAVRRVLRGESVPGTLDLTGPHAFGRDVNTLLGRHPETPWTLGTHDTHIMCDNGPDGVYVRGRSTPFVNKKYEGWKKDRKPGAHYSVMFAKGRVFNPALPDTFHNEPTEKTIFIVERNRYVTPKRYSVAMRYQDMNPEWDLRYAHPDDIKDLLYTYGGVAVMNTCTTYINVNSLVEDHGTHGVCAYQDTVTQTDLIVCRQSQHVDDIKNRVRIETTHTQK